MIWCQPLSCASDIHAVVCPMMNLENILMCEVAFEFVCVCVLTIVFNCIIIINGPYV
jgi:hypothetical protein